MESPNAIRAVYEDGVFRPLVPVTLPESTKVTVVPESTVVPPGCNAAVIYEIMSRSYDTGQTDAAARVDEHQP